MASCDVMSFRILLLRFLVIALFPVWVVADNEAIGLAELYKKHCAECHEDGTVPRAPTSFEFPNIGAAAIYKSFV
ncbi:MAG: hypothetical protein DRR42_21290, partial [Gammaproteobacteria bacterium]